MARRALALATLLNQVNAAFPARNKASDGWIGDSAHQAVQSDHNPNNLDVVLAQDITHDPENGCDIQEIADNIIDSGDERVWYIIFNKRIWEQGIGWKPYDGENDHTKHGHFNMLHDETYYDNEKEWTILKGEDMRVTDPLFRREWSLLGLDIGPEGRQPKVEEINEAVGKDVYQWLDEFGQYAPIKRQREKAALFDAVVSELQKSADMGAQDKLNKIKEILK